MIRKDNSSVIDVRLGSRPVVEIYSGHFRVWHRGSRFLRVAPICVWLSMVPDSADSEVTSNTVWRAAIDDKC